MTRGGNKEAGVTMSGEVRGGVEGGEVRGGESRNWTAGTGLAHRKSTCAAVNSVTRRFTTMDMGTDGGNNEEGYYQILGNCTTGEHQEEVHYKVRGRCRRKRRRGLLPSTWEL